MMTAQQALQDRVVVVTGASSGIGRATAIAAAAAGACVVLAARRAELLADTAHIIEGAGGRALGVPCDLTRPADVGRLVEAATSVTGRVDALVHAAGTNIRERALDALTSERWAHLLDTNLTAAFELTHAFVPLFRHKRRGYSSISPPRRPRSRIARGSPIRPVKPGWSAWRTAPWKRSASTACARP